MTTPLLNHIQFYGMNEYGNNIILGQAVDIPELDPHKNILPRASRNNPLSP